MADCGRYYGTKLIRRLLEGWRRPQARAGTGGRARRWLESLQRQPLRNNPRKSASELVMSDYIMSVNGGAAATEPRAAGNAMLCKNAHLEPTKTLGRNDKQE